MTKFTVEDETVPVNRIPAKESYIFIRKMTKTTKLIVENWDDAKNIHYTKYQIKETDMRVKTATFTSPQYIDLTTGRYAVLITSPYHENFSGIILSVDYDDETGLYSYQCQDWSRNYMGKTENNYTGVLTVNILKNQITRGNVTVPTPKASELEEYKEYLSGLRPSVDYEQKNWGSTVSFNPMNETPNLIIRDKTRMSVIRDLIYGNGAYIDLWFNNNGVLQFEPYQKKDFFNTGLHLVRPEAVNQKYKFDTTNIITSVIVQNQDDKRIGRGISDETLISYFGSYTGEISNPNPKTTTDTKTATTVTGSKTTTSNPYKSKKVWINADNGSDDMKNQVAQLLKENGWTVHVGRTGSNVHYEDYYNVTKDYVYVTMYNGFCAGTVREAYSSSIQNTLKKKNVQLVIMWDTSGWTNPNGMKPYRYGDFTGYSAGRAWDDNFSSSDPSISNVSKFLKDNNAIYCAYPNAEGLVDQFLAGGYFNAKK